MYENNTAWIGRIDGGSIKLSNAGCQEVLAVIQKYDPEGVAAGNYFIDVDMGESDEN